MRFVLTLVGGTSLDGETVRAAHDALTNAGAVVGAADWLAEDHACDLAFEELDAQVAEAAVRAQLNSSTVDVAAQGRDGRRKRLLVADLESTVIRNEMLDELADLIGCGDDVTAITARAMNGEIDFCQSVRDRVALLAGQPDTRLDDVWTRVVYDPGAATLVATCRAHGVITALVSGGFHVFADRVAAALGFDHVQANRLIVDEGLISGSVREPILDREAKQVALEGYCADLGLAPSETAAVGDGANDLALLAAAGLGVAFRAKPAVAAAARFRIEHGDLTALLYFQGYRANALTRREPTVEPR